MTVRASLMQQLENPALTSNQRAQLRCEASKAIEDTGDYMAAREMLGELWRGVCVRPKLEGLDAETSAELLLRVGVLTGWIGDISQIKDAQESAKNLISESIGIFESLRYIKKVLEGRTEIAYCYWREGSYDEARDILKGILEQITTDSALRAKAVLRSAIVERSATRYNDALHILTDHAPLFDKIRNHTIKGGYHNELAIILRNLGTSERRPDYIDRAFVEYAAAGYHFEKAGHKCYRANVENNLGYLHYKAGRYAEAHEHLEYARRLLINLKDSCTVAQVDETRARVFLAQNRHTEAERAARAAVVALEKGGRQSLLAEALTTHGTALARLGYAVQARFMLFRAIEVAHQYGALNYAGLAALTVIEELSEQLSAEERQSIYERAYHWLVSSQNQETLRRLLLASNRMLNTGQEQKEARTKKFVAEPNYTLRELVTRYEGNLIRQALRRAGGSVTQAARLLGLTHQALIYILEHRHNDLMPDRTPIQRRRRSVVRDGQD